MTKAIIISGGWGTRLRPLTCTIPKSLIPVVNKPVIERQIIHLKAAGVKEVVLGVSVMSEALKSYFHNGERLGVEIHYTHERHPMGTAGAIKLAENLLKDDNFFMLNGDVILNFNFSEMLKCHEEKGGIGTIASKIVEDPSRYGVLIVEEKSQRILEFLEKDEYHPPGGKYIPMPINAGVYILEPQIFSYVKPNKKISIEREVFPVVAKSEKLYNYSISGIWKDIGKPYELLEGNIELMNDILKNLKIKRKNLIDDSIKIEGKVEIIPPCTIGENVVVRENCKIGPNVIIGDNVYIDKGTEIKETLIYNETYISKKVKIEKAIISDNCNVHENVELIGNGNNLVILASYVEISKNIQLISRKDYSLTICHHEIVKESII
jgi:NDP-sugar pyrophosphorylase family protein